MSGVISQERREFNSKVYNKAKVMQHQNSPMETDTARHHSEMLSLQEALNCLRKQFPPSIMPSPQGIASLSRVTSKMIFWWVSWGLPAFAYHTLLYSWNLKAWRSLMCPRCRTVPLSLFSFKDIWCLWVFKFNLPSTAGPQSRPILHEDQQRTTIGHSSPKQLCKTYILKSHFCKSLSW